MYLFLYSIIYGKGLRWDGMGCATITQLHSILQKYVSMDWIDGTVLKCTEMYTEHQRVQKILQRTYV